MIVEAYADVIVLSGALRSNFWDTIHTAISLTLKRHPTGVIVDCSGITECSPEGADTFVDAMGFIKDHDARIIVAAVPSAIIDVLKSVPNVRSQLAFATSVEAARRSLDLLVEDTEGKKKKAPIAEINALRIVVCLYDGTSVAEDNAAMELASRIADSVPSDIHLVCALLVPRELPLQAPLEASEASASNAVERAKTFFTGHNLPHHSRVERVRDVASMLATIIAELDAQQIILPLIGDPIHQDDNLKLVKAVLSKIDRQVSFVRPKI